MHLQFKIMSISLNVFDLHSLYNFVTVRVSRMVAADSNNHSLSFLFYFLFVIKLLKSLKACNKMQPNSLVKSSCKNNKLIP